MPIGFYIVTHDTEKNDIIFEVNNEVAKDKEIPDEQQNLVIDIANVLFTIQAIYKDYKLQYLKAFEQIFFIAKTGLEGINAQPALAAKALTQLKKEIVDKESGRIKNSYLKTLGFLALQFGMPLLLLGSITILVMCCFVSTQTGCFDFVKLANFFILWSGSMLGVWLSFAITKTYLAFDELAVLEKDHLEPALRLIFTGILAEIFGLLFLKGVIVIKIASLSSENLSTDYITAFLLGIVLGINEKIIGGVLSKKAVNLIKE